MTRPRVAVLDYGSGNIRSAQRAHEMVLYDFLYLLYESRAARERKGGERPPKKGKEKKGEAAAG